jgi:hemerythrin-like metal-binding protein
MAEYIVWRDEYSVSDDSVDMQHKRIIGMLNGVFALVKKGSSREEMERLLTDLKTYTETHFEYEEKMMRMAGYPEIKRHESAHKTMAEKTVALCLVQQKSATGIMPDEVLDFLKDWWVNHIRGVDTLYAPFLSELKTKDS